MRRPGRVDRHLQAVERVVGRVGHDHRGHAGQPGEALAPQLEVAVLARPDGGMVAPLPGLERGDGADHALLADLHAAADAAVLQEGGAHQLAAAGDDAGGRPAEELVRAVDDDVGAAGEEAGQVVFRGGVDDHRHALGMAISATSSSGSWPYCTVWCETT